MQRRTTLLLLLVVLVSLAFGSAQGRSIDLRLVKHPRMQVAQSVARLQHALRQADVSYDYPMDGNVYPVGIYWTKIALGTWMSMMSACVCVYLVSDDRSLQALRRSTSRSLSTLGTRTIRLLDRFNQ